MVIRVNNYTRNGYMQDQDTNGCKIRFMRKSLEIYDSFKALQC